ncbi:putative NRPS-like protein biosynthetic cluster [Sporothrix eucalyptigena]|uniref:NRPS-like protein biosynthetic cluster n=1 Tax=Sporothrix eucalyptigena TaxID=1812306 RepID=A0ABP0C3I1_9PEZI
MSDELPHINEFKRAAKRLDYIVKNDPQLLAAAPDLRVSKVLRDPSLSYRQVITGFLTAYEERPALGVRAYDVVDGVRHNLPKFDTITYGGLRTQIEAVSCAWRFEEKFAVRSGEFVASIVFTGAEYVAIDIGCVYSQAISVPIQANLQADVALGILADVAPAALVISIDYLDQVIHYAVKQETVRSVVVINANQRVTADNKSIENARKILSEAGRPIALATFADLVDVGKKHTYTHLPTFPGGRNALSMLMYTSGSTGTPKGAQIHEGICLMFWAELERTHPIIIVADAPVNHWMGRVEIIHALATGGTCFFTLMPDLSTFVEDVQIVRPTWMQVLPRFAELVYQNHVSALQGLVNSGMDPEAADAQLRKKLDGYLGDRLCLGVIGSSPTAPEVKQFFRDTFQMSVLEGYGSTESSGGATTLANYINHSLVIDYKLRDVPELGYYTTDKPFPRGELLVKTRHQFQGYFKRPEATASAFDEGGYVITGDIMEQRSKEELVWLDRRNNVIKLSQAEFVAITPLESTYLGENPLVKQIYVYGSSYRSFLLAVIVPDVDYAEKLLGHTPSDEELRQLALRHLRARAQSGGLKSFEIPRDVIIEREPFTSENGLLSSVRKALRPNLKKKYGDRLEAIYEDMDRQRLAELQQLREPTSKRETSTVDRVARAFKANLGLANVDAESPQTYRELGGDSMGAVGLSQLLREMFFVSVPASVILGAQSSVGEVAHIVDRLKAAAASGSNRPTFDSVHGDDVTTLRATKLVLPSFFDVDSPDISSRSLVSGDVANTVLITGSTGFLGRFLLLQWMEKLAVRGGKVIAIVRARNNNDARARLHETFGNMDATLTEYFTSLAKDHLEVVAGDLSLPQLGLPQQDFKRLARDVDQIVHPGALVNHRLSYQDLFEPNVVGTAELVRLALTSRQKRFDYVSTIGVPYANEKLLEADEDADVRVEAHEMPLSDDYAVGYTASKWAGEVLLRDAHERFGLDVDVFRPNMILAHSQYIGQINVPDMFTRLLLSLVATGLAPLSFYGLTADGQRTSGAHYDGLPVDVLAKVMQGAGDTAYSGFNSYNTINFHYNDGVSLDSFVDWVESAGYPIKRITDHTNCAQAST